MIRLTQAQLVQQIDQLTVSENRIIAEEEAIIKECQQELTELQNAKMTNQKHVTDLVQCYLKPVSRANSNTKRLIPYRSFISLSFAAKISVIYSSNVFGAIF